MAAPKIRIRRLDSRNFVVEKYVLGEKSGKWDWQNEGYYTSLLGAAYGAIELCANGDNAKELIATAKESRAAILEAVKKCEFEYEKSNAGSTDSD